jgi:hypothetical protein
MSLAFLDSAFGVNVNHRSSHDNQAHHRVYHAHPKRASPQREAESGSELEPCSTYVVSSDWLSASCANATNKSTELPLAINAIDGSSHQHHSSFKRYSPFLGSIFDRSRYLVDFLGFNISRALYCNDAYMPQIKAHALRVRQCGHLGPKTLAAVQTAWPVVSEEYFVSLSTVDNLATIHD